MSADFSKYLNVSVDNVETAKPLPAGHYLSKIVSWKGAERDYKNGEPVVPVVEFTCRTVAPDEDVDEDLLPANGGVGVLVTIDYRLVAPNSQGKVEGGGQDAIRRLAENIGIPTKGLHIADILDELKNQDVKVFCEAPREDKRSPETFYTNARKLLPAS